MEAHPEWHSPTFTRRGTPRARLGVRASLLVRGETRSRLLVFVTEPTARLLGWKNGGSVAPMFSDNEPGKLKIAPAHTGLRATRGKKSGTLRIVVSGAPVLARIQSPVQEVPYALDHGTLLVWLPTQWFAAQ